MKHTHTHLPSACMYICMSVASLSHTKCSQNFHYKPRDNRRQAGSQVGRLADSHIDTKELLVRIQTSWNSALQWKAFVRRGWGGGTSCVGGVLLFYAGVFSFFFVGILCTLSYCQFLTLFLYCYGRSSRWCLFAAFVHWRCSCGIKTDERTNDPNMFAFIFG